MKMAYSSRKLATYAVTGILIAAIIITSMQIQFSYGTGTLTILVTDPPEWGPASHVYINITKIEVHSNSSGWSRVQLPGGIHYLWLNLTSTINATAILVKAYPLNPGKYNLIRFEISDALVTVNGINETARVPSGKLTIAIVRGGVTIRNGADSTLLLDIETKVVYSKGKGYQLVPAAKAIPLGD